MPSIIQTDTIKDASATNTLVEQSGSDWKWASGVPEGTVLQVKSTNKTSYASMTGTGALNWQDISGLSVSITPQTGSEVLILVNMMTGSSAYQNVFRIARGSTAIGVGTAHNSKPAVGWATWVHHGNESRMVSYHYLDTTPGGDGSTAITYKIQTSLEGSASNHFTINGSHTDTDAYQTGRGISTITVMEIAS